MRCEEVEHHIADHLAGLRVDPGLVEHLAGCVECRNEVEALRITWADLESVKVPARAARMRPNLVATIAAVKAETQHIPTWRRVMPYAFTSLLLALVLAGGWEETSLVRSSQNVIHYRGTATAPVTLVEYGDYECPFCASYNVALKDLLQRYGSRVRLEYLHYPLPNHPNAVLAASAAEAAGEQGQYWEMNDLLFESQTKWAH